MDCVYDDKNKTKLLQKYFKLILLNTKIFRNL